MTQTLYAHMNIIQKEKKKKIVFNYFKVLPVDKGLD
jgi:hypothetical protein